MASDKIRLKVASPCKASWEQMTGDDAVRFCGTCRKNVYMLSSMSTEQVEALLTGAGETPCVRFYQRRDGSVMTADCPVGARTARRKRAAFAAGAGVLSALGVALAPAGAPQPGAIGPQQAAPPPVPLQVQPTEPPADLRFAKPPPPLPEGELIMGEPAPIWEPEPGLDPDLEPRLGKVAPPTDDPE